MLPNHRLLTRAFHRVPVPISKATSNAPTARRLSNSSINQKWEGSKAKDHTARETDSHNVVQDATRDGKAERAKGEGSSGTSEKAGVKGEANLNKKAERDYKEAPKPVIGMNDERGSVSLSIL
jgi:hypothetical protein